MVGMGPYVDGHVLSWIIFMPGATALFLLAIGAVLRGFFGSAGLPGEVWRAIALGSTGLTLLLASAGLFVAFEPETMGLQLVEYADWLPGYGVQYFVAVDGINLFPVLLVTLLVPLVLIASWGRVERSLRSFVFFLLFLESAILGVFLSFNVLLFHLFWQLALVAVYFIIGIWGGARAHRRGDKISPARGCGRHAHVGGDPRALSAQLGGQRRSRLGSSHPARKSRPGLIGVGDPGERERGEREEEEAEGGE